MAELKLQIDKLEGSTNWNKWKWQIKMHFEQYELTSIVDGTRLLPVPKDGESETEKKKNESEWKRDNAKAAALIASTLTPPVADLVMTCTDAKDIWDKLISVFEQSSIQRLNLLMTQFFQVSREITDNVATHAAKVERIFNEMNDELKRIGSSAIPAELLHGKILQTVGKDYQEFNNVWESFDAEKRTTKNLVEKLCTIEQRVQSTNSSGDYSAFAARVPAQKKKFVRNAQNASDNANTSRNRTEKPKNCFKCGSSEHLCRECPKKKFNNPSKNYKGAFTANVNAVQADAWICDSGASHHMTSNKQYFETYRHFPVPVEISLADKNKIYAIGSGKVNIELFINGKWYEAHMEDVWYVPDVRRHLFSVQQAAKHDVEVKMTDSSVEFYRSEELVAVGLWKEGTYVMSMKVVVPSCPAEVSFATESETLQVWHERLGHQNKRHVRKLLSEMNIRVSHAVTSDFCDGCALGKAHRKPFKPRPNRATSVGEVINADVNGPMSVDSFTGARYFVCFKDDYSKYRRIFFLKKKSEVSSCLRMFLNEATNQGHVVKSLRCDGGGEFDCGEVREILAEKGTVLTVGIPYTPEQNGAAERENRSIVELARSMLSTCELPRSLWANACETAVYLLNHTGVSPEDNKSPHELWTGQKMIELDHLRVFGTECYAHIPKNFRRKFDNKSVHGHMVGYVNDKDGYKIYLPSQKKIIKSRDVDFKTERLCTTSVAVEVEEETNENLEEVQREENEHLEETQNVRRSDRQRSMPTWMKSGEFLLANVAAVEESEDPSTYSEALSSSDSHMWLNAMQEEMDALHKNNTWDLVDLPKGSKVINCRWVLRKKFNPDGTIERYRARLVAKGYAQKAGLDYDETFSPVARYDTVRSVLAVTAKEKLHLQQFDVKTAFLYGTLQEEVFMTQPEGFNDKSGRVCRLYKSLYGLKQSPRCWNQCFVDFVKKQNLKASTADPCLFVRQKDGKKLFVAIYVDDGLVAGTDEVEVEEFMDQLAHSFQITRGSLGQFLGMSITQLSDSSIFVNQSAYAKKVLSRFQMDCANPVATPSDKSYVSNDEQNDPIGKEIPYRQAVGSLMYLAIATRPDLAYAISVVSENLENPKTSDWCAVKRIFKYLKGTVDFGLLYKADCHPCELEVYSDADYAGDVKTRRSRTGMVSKFSGGAISWMSQKQKSVVLSTTEAEYVAASESAKELIWLKRLLGDITTFETPSLLVDNASAVKLAKNPEYHKRSKHVDVRYHFVREKFIEGELHIKHVPGTLQVADIMTKPLASVRFKELCNLLGLFSFHFVND